MDYGEKHWQAGLVSNTGCHWRDELVILVTALDLSLNIFSIFKHHVSISSSGLVFSHQHYFRNHGGVSLLWSLSNAGLIASPLSSHYRWLPFILNIIIQGTRLCTIWPLWYLSSPSQDMYSFTFWPVKSSLLWASCLWSPISCGLLFCYLECSSPLVHLINSNIAHLTNVPIH